MWRVLVLGVLMVLLAGCDAAADNITGAIQSDAEARREAAAAQNTAALAEQTLAEAERIKAQAVADAQAAYARQIEEANRRYAAAQEARVQDARNTTVLVVAGALLFAIAGVVLFMAWRAMHPPMLQPQVQVIERVIERQVVYLQAQPIIVNGASYSSPFEWGAFFQVGDLDSWAGYDMGRYVNALKACQWGQV